MANVLINEDTMKGIADSIRNKTENTSTKYRPSEMSTAINNIQTKLVLDNTIKFGYSYFTKWDSSKFDTSKVDIMDDMFSNMTGSSLDLSELDTSNVTSMANMFNLCASLTSLDVSNFDTSNVTSMASMFSFCSSLTSLDVSNFDTSNVTNMTGMFNFCSSLASITFGENWISVASQTYSNQTTDTWTRASDGKTYTGLQVLLEAGRTKGVIVGT